MPSCSSAQPTKVDIANNENMLPSTDSLEGTLKAEEEEEEEEEEDGDADFNPFLKESPSQEASSSLSSEVDGLDGDVVNSGLSMGTNLSKLTTREQICTVVDSEHGEEEIIMQASLSADGSCEKELKMNAICSSKKRKSALISQSETNRETENGLTSETDGNVIRIGELSNTTKSQSPMIELDNEDAICMRTRARYSLASFTLDELETFLQETDDDDDLQNADDEEEYRKFLAAVLQDGDGDGLSTHQNENLDDEDEDNDADFEIELEELLESDVDENAAVKTQKEYDGAGRRPETRQNKRQKASSQCEKKISGQVKRPLRPILPNFPNGALASGKALMPETTLNFQYSASGNGLVNGFTPQQIGQLHSLIHEHVQLLIQVFSLSILEPSQQKIASEVQGLLFEMLHKCDEVLASKRVPYPSICFTPSYICSSVSNGVSKFVPGQCNIESASTYEAQRVCFPQSNQSSSEGRCEYILKSQRNYFQDTEGSFWVPFVRGPVLSILDVAPLNLVGRYVDDIHSAVQECRKRYFESGCDSRVEKEPLFPCSPSYAEANSEVSSGTISGAINTVSTSPGLQQPKKTLAAMLVESTKKQSIALVPKEVARLTQRFFPLFNPALFPHKPPPAAVANRVLFTDSEDELLALGLMEYNTDWKAIQQRFLPCKSKHQIFVRQKNRCSSKAPENPIKAVRRMKTSPLTAEEITCIQEGLKVYKFDWMSVWQYIVPHRDPSLLPRQWRIALGTQKSYKVDASKREKRRLYESKRRKLKAAALESWQAISDKEDCEAEIASAENCMDYSNVPYVHQAFLADWRPDVSTLTWSGCFSATSGEGNLAHDAILQDTQFYRGSHNYGRKGQPQIGNQPASYPSVSKLPQFCHTTSDLRSGIHGSSSAIRSKNLIFDATPTSSKYYYRPYRSRRVNSSHLVKLAPDLPPVNLPPSVRVVSQTAFKGYHCGTSKIYPPGDSVATCRKDNSVSQIPVKGTSPALKDSVTGSQLERSGTADGGSVVAEKGTSTDLQMHPLLFQATEDDSVPYYPLKSSSSTSSSFGFFSRTQPQLNLSLFHTPQQQSHVDCSDKSLKSKDSTLRSGGIGFHPLLQKCNDTQLQTSFDAIQTESLVNSGVPSIANRSSGLNDKSNELDLEIHLSSASGIEKSVKSRQLKAPDSMGSIKTVAIGETALEPQENSVSYCQQGGKDPSASSSKLTSCAHPLAIPTDNISRCDVDDIGDQSHPEIVMEQEELSDSEEDIEENVEFECEEMADSEGEEGSDCEQVLEVQSKEVPTSAAEKAAKQTACMKKLCEPRANSDTQVDDSLLTNNPGTLNMALTSEGKDDKSSSSWLSLDSRTADNHVLSMTKHKGSSETPNSRNLAFSRPSRCCKTTNSCGKAVTEGHTIDMVQQLSLGPLVFAAPRKPRKRSGKSSANLDIGLTVESSSREGNHKDG